MPKDGKYDVFISHSSRDMAFVRKLILFLKNSKGVENAYVDWLDPAMGQVTDAQTAVYLKSRIKDARKVIYVVTTESLKSAWCSHTQTLLQVGLGPTSNTKAIEELRPVRHQSGLTHSGSLLLYGQ